MMTTDGLASPAPGCAAGMELFYSAESIRLALAWPDANLGDTGWASLEPATHIGYVRDRGRLDVATLLLAKYGRLPAAAQGDALRVLDALYCGVPADDPAGGSPGSPAREGRLSQSVAEVFRWTSVAADPRGTGPLRLWSRPSRRCSRGAAATPTRHAITSIRAGTGTGPLPSRSASSSGTWQTSRMSSSSAPPRRARLRRPGSSPS